MMDSDPPVLAICLPVLNQAGWFREALLKLSEQTYTEFSVFVFDNGSEDNIEGICQEFSSVLNLSYERSEAILPKAVSWTRALLGPKAEYVMLHHADDYLDLDSVQFLTKTLSENSEVDVVHGNFFPI